MKITLVAVIVIILAIFIGIILMTVILIISTGRLYGYHQRETLEPVCSLKLS